MNELIHLRQENTKTYDLGGGKRSLLASIGAIHYKDDYSDRSEQRNYPGEQWKDINLTWEDNKITKAPYELTLEGKKLTIRDKKTGEVSTIELLEIDKKGIPDKAWERSKGLAKAPGIVNLDNVALDTDLEIAVENDRVKFVRILKSSKAPVEAKFRVTGNWAVRARDTEGELPVEATLANGILVETLKPERIVKYPVRIDPTWQVTLSTDDCQRIPTTTNYWSILFTNFQVAYQEADYADAGAAARFLNITIPAGSNIVQADLVLTCSGATAGGVVNTRLRAQKHITPLTFSTAADFDARTWTTAKANWDAISAWTGDIAYTSPDIKACIQEVIDLPGWAEGPIVILLDDFEKRSTQADGAYRVAYSWDGSAAKAPKLHIEYELIPPPTVTTQPASSIEAHSAIGNGTVTVTAENVTRRGFEWDINSPAPLPITYDKIVSGDAARFEQYPAIVKDASDKLYVVYTKYDTNVEDITGKIVMRTSIDGGATWSAESTVADTAGANDKNPTIGIFTYGGIEKLIVAYTPLSDIAGRVVTSPTSSISWSVPVSLGANRIVGTGHPIQLSNGKLLIPVYSLDEGGAGNRDGYIEESDDGGATWTEYDINASHEMSEWSIIETKTGGAYTGGVYGLVRNNLHPLTFYKVTSTDYGHTFTEPSANDILLRGQSPSRMIRLPDDNILAVYAFERTSNYAPPTTIRLSVSVDECQTWKVADEVIQYGSGSAPNYDQVDYPDVILYGSNTLIVVYGQMGYGTMVGEDIWLNYPTYYTHDVHEHGSWPIGAFALALTGLPASTTIYTRAYALNSGGMGYGAEVSFLTKEPGAYPSMASKLAAVGVV